MQITSRKEGDILAVEVLEQRIDARIAVDFKQSLSELIDQGNSIIVLNLSAVEFIDSTGLAAIVSSLKKLGREGEMVISGVQETVMTMFKLTRMNKVFQMFETEAQALVSLSK